MALAAEAYRVTSSFPDNEKFGLVSQMRCCLDCSNIAESAARQNRKELIHFLYIASGSASELSTQSQICLRISMRDQQELQALLQTTESVARTLRSLIKSLKISL